MRDLRKSLFLKVVAVFLLVISAFTAVLSFAGAVAYHSYGIGMGESFFDSEEFRDMAWTAGRMAHNAWQGNDYDLERNYGVNYGYEIYALPEGTGLESGDAADPKEAYLWGEPLASRLLKNGETVAYARVVENTVVVGHVSVDLRHGDRFYDMSLLFGLLHRMGPMLVPVLAVSLLLFFAMLVFLLCAAGHRRGCAGIVPNLQDRIPLDLYLAGALLLGFVIAALLAEAGSNAAYSSNDEVFYLACFALLGTLLLLMGLAVLMTLATRLKLGKWWKNSIIYVVCTAVLGLLRRSVRAAGRLGSILPFTWRIVLAAAAYLFAVILLCTLMWLERNMPAIWLLMLVLLVLVSLGAAAVAAWQMKSLLQGGEALVAGDLESKVDTDKMLWPLRRHAENLNAIGEGMNRAVEQRMRSERLKTELITNVSHDIKTPLTSIVNYVDLLGKEELPEPAAGYVEVLERQSRRLKKLTEDLVEASKASTGNVAVELRPTVLNELLHQAVGEYGERLTAGQLEVVVNTLQGNVVARADGRLLWRVMDNLLSNVSKYAQPGTRVYLDLRETETQVLLSVKNISREQLNLAGEELTERFVRGDRSRSTEGSGLGLNIAKSLMELMGGELRITVDGDLFKAELALPRAERTVRE